MVRVPAPACAVIRAVAGIVGHRAALRSASMLKHSQTAAVTPATADRSRNPARSRWIGLASSPLADTWAVEMTIAAAEPTEAHRGLTMTE